MKSIQKMAEYLLKNALPSIKLRVRKEVYGDLDTVTGQKLLEEIEQEKNMRTVTDSIHPDGWIGNAFHGASAKMRAGMYDNMEVGMCYCAEKGLPPEHRILRGAADALLKWDRMDPVYGSSGKLIDYETTALDLRLSRSSVLIRAGYETLLPPHAEIHLPYDVNRSFEAFCGVLAVDDVSAILRPHGKKLVFTDGTVWPCIYDLRPLAFSRGWRGEEQYRVLGESVKKLFRFPQEGPGVYSYAKLITGRQVMGPCFAFIHRPVLEPFSKGAAHAGWFDKMELFARCGVVHRVPELMGEYERLLYSIDDDGICTLPVQKQYFQKWSPYFGLALEPDWKTKTRRNCDVTFRALMIAHYTEKYRMDGQEPVN